MSGPAWVAMENTLFGMGYDWDERCAAIAEAGFSAVYATPYPLQDDDFPRLRRLAEVPRRHGLRIAGVYANHDLSLPEEHPTNAATARLCDEVEGAPRIELSFKASDPAALASAKIDDLLRTRLEPLLQRADRRGLEVLLYHHSFYPLETLAHAARVVDGRSHPRLGLVFAASHVFAVQPAAAVVTELAQWIGRVRSINVCGCRRSAPGPRAKTVALPLGAGDLDIMPLLQCIVSAGYAGDVIVQGHGWGHDARAWLRQSYAYLVDGARQVRR